MSTAEILANREYKYGWVTDIEAETIPRGLSEDTVRLISAKKSARSRLSGHDLLQRSQAESDCGQSG